MLDKNGNKIAGPFGKPTAPDNGFQADGPAIDIGFENKFQGGRLFATDSNQSIRTSGNNDSSRIVIVDINANTVTPFIVGLPTGDHPAEQLEFKDGWIYWSQGSTTNSGVVGLDNGGWRQPAGHSVSGHRAERAHLPIASPTPNVFFHTSGYTKFGVTRPGETVKAFEGATSPGMCDGAILRAKLNSRTPQNTIEPFSRRRAVTETGTATGTETVTARETTRTSSESGDGARRPRSLHRLAA